MQDLGKTLRDNTYPGRGILLGKSSDGKSMIAVYFIMGRSVNSRNRIFVRDGEGLRTQAFDAAKLSDPSLVIYAPVRVLGGETIVTNGDQTDTVYDALRQGKSFEDALRTRTFEPDGPIFTPRISGMLCGEDMKLSIIKSEAGNPDGVQRFFYEYTHPAAGVGRLIHTYLCDGDPVPSFQGEPVCVELAGSIDQVTDTVWQNLNEQNKVSLFVRFIRLDTGETEDRICNKNGGNGAA